MPKSELSLQQEFQRSLSLFEAGLLAEARAALVQIHAGAQARPAVLHLRGLVEAGLGEPRAALRLLDQCARLAPKDPALLTNRGKVLRTLGRLEEAAQSYRKAIALDPGFAPAHGGLGAALAELGNAQDALFSYARVLEINPSDADTHFNRANALADLRHYEEARQAYGEAIALNPVHASYHNNLGTVLAALGDGDAALASCERAIELDPGLADAHANRGLVLHLLGRQAEAGAAYEEALRIDPDYPYARGRRLYVRQLCCDWQNFSDELDALRAACRAGRPACAPFEALGLLESPAEQLAVARAWVGARFAAARKLALSARHHADRIRVAYLSSDFGDHAVTYLASELFERHDRANFEIHALGWSRGTNSARRQRIVAAVDKFSDISGLSDGAAAQLVANLGIDIAVNLNGCTAGERTGIFALRPAPVQIQYLGYPGSMGAPFIDYMIADRFAIPPGEERYYAEKIVFMPGCFQVNDSRRSIAGDAPSRAAAGLPADGFVFCCFASGHKLNPPLFDSWTRILGAVPGSVLWLAEHNANMASNLRRAAMERGVAAERLVFAAKIGYAEHLARYGLADLCLDSFPFNGGTTTSDALWAGLPVLALAGRSFSGRMSGSLLNALGLPELIVTSATDYEHLAVALAGDRGVLDALRKRVAANPSRISLFDGARFSRDLEKAYSKIWQRYLQRRAPANLAVEPAT